MALVLGAGKMGIAIAHDLMKSGVEARICDIKAAHFPNFFFLDARNDEDVLREMKGEDVVISALPYDFNLHLAKLAIKAKTNFIDLGGNSYIVEKELQLHEEARKKGVTIIPDCGLAPGMTNIVAYHLWREGERNIHIRVGGLPQHPCGPLFYALFFSIHGLINEYLEDAIIVRNGKVCKVASLTGIEEIKFENFPPLEAFYTHGGTSTLPKTLEGVKELDYKTIRYKGHAEKIMLLKQLGFFDEEAREFTERILEKALPKDEKDVVLARIYGKDAAFELIDYHDGVFSAMQRTTGFSTAIIARMVADGETRAGAYPPELAVDGEKFMEEARKRGIVWRAI
ncbi:MAG: saccharopine dehydrogenase NADP-binding domain-containing protein [Thermoplasmata archaeon]|nr:saccharopine dehydrogenase NADP-binding domain-containing protein [Thermoplasmata archaeon]